MTALDKNGLTVIMSPSKGSGCLNIVMTASNKSLNTLDQFLFQVGYWNNSGGDILRTIEVLIVGIPELLSPKSFKNSLFEKYCHDSDFITTSFSAVAHEKQMTVIDVVKRRIF